jgi:hypothetical protein
MCGADLATLVAWARLGAVVSSPAIGAHTLSLLPLQVACTVTSTNGAVTILRAFLITREPFEACFTCALGTLWSLLSKILITDVAASVSRAEVSRVLVTAWAFVFTDVTQEALVAVADWLEFVVHCALATARAQVLVLITWAQQVALAAKESRHALALGSAVVSNSTVTLATAHGEHSALAVAAWALECALFAKEARIECAVLWLGWTTKASHEQTMLQ